MSRDTHTDLQSQRRMRTDEDLLEYQKRFKEDAIVPSAKVVRAVRKPAAAPTVTQPSLSPQEEEESKSATSSSSINSSAPPDSSTSASTDSSSAALVFPHGQSITEHAQITAPRPPLTQVSLAASKTGFPKTFKARLAEERQEKVGSHSNTSNATISTSASSVSASSTATAAAAVQQPEKKKSLFAQQRDRMLTAQRAAAPASSSAATSSTATVMVVEREVVQLSTQPIVLDHKNHVATSATSNSASSSSTSSSSSTAKTLSPASTTSSYSSSSIIPIIPEARGISDENNLKIGMMSVEEIEENQRELESMLPPSLIAMLRARGGGGNVTANTSVTTTGPTSKPVALNPLQTLINNVPLATQLDEDLLGDVDQDSSSSDEDHSNSEDEGMEEDGTRVTRVKERLAQDAALEAYSAQLLSKSLSSSTASEASKLEWTTPIEPTGKITWPADVQGYANDSSVWNDWRVDLEGRFIGEDMLSKSASSAASASVASDSKVDDEHDAFVSSSKIDYSDPTNALYHHGDQADRPGYTMREVLHLIRSTVMSQRTLALQILSRVLKRLRYGKYAYPREDVQVTKQGARPAKEMFDTSPQDDSPPPFSHLLFSHLLYLNIATLLRLALDDNRNLSGIRAALTCLENLLFIHKIHITQVQDRELLHKGYEHQRRYEETLSVVGEMDEKAQKEKEKKKIPASTGQQEEDETGTRPEERDASHQELQAAGLPHNENDNASDEDLCAKDMYVGMIRMKLLERLRFIMEVHVLPALMQKVDAGNGKLKQTAVLVATASSTTPDFSSLLFLSPTLNLLLSLTLHSPQAASKLFDTPRLMDILVKVVQALIRCVTSGAAGVGSSSASSSSSSSLTATLLSTCLLLIGSLSQVHRDIAFYFIKQGVFNACKAFLVMTNGLPGAGVNGQENDACEAELAMLLPLSIRTLHNWRICLAYGLDIESFMDHYPVLLGVLNTTKRRIKDVVSPLSSLWLQQLSHVCHVLEGLTLLFLPRTPASQKSVSLPADASSSHSAPPAALSFEFAHIMHTIDQVLSILPDLLFAASPSSSSYLPTLLSSFLHLISTYYSVLPSQSTGVIFDINLMKSQTEKHLEKVFVKLGESGLIQQARKVVKEYDWIVEETQQTGKQLLTFTNLLLSTPSTSSSSSTLQHSLNLLFSITRWITALSDVRQEIAPTWIGVLRETEAMRRELVEHFYRNSSSKSKGAINRVHSRLNLLSSLESEFLVSLLILNRFDPAPSHLSTPQFYSFIMQLIPTLLRNGQQYLVSKLMKEVMFDEKVVKQLNASADAQLDSSSCSLLHSIYTHFSYLPEELLISTLLHTNNILTPTLCAAVATQSNVVATTQTSVGGNYCVLKDGENNGSTFPTSGVYLLNILKHSKYLQIQSEKRSENTKLRTVFTLLRFLRMIDLEYGVLTPAPMEGSTTAHPAAMLCLRAILEFYLLGSDVFLEEEFSDLTSHFFTRLLAPNSDVDCISSQYIGLPNHAQSTLMFGASITAPVDGDATMRTQGEKQVRMMNPAEQGRPMTEREGKVASNAASSSSSSFALVASSSSSALLSQHIPYYPFSTLHTLPTLYGPSFYPLFKSLIELYVSDSMGDITFAKIVLLFLRQEYPTDYRLVIWRECAELMQSLDVGDEEEIPVNTLGYYFPYETNGDILQLLISHIAGHPTLLTSQRNSFLYSIAIHHVAIYLFGWSHVSGEQVMAASERVRRVQDMCPMTISPECAKDLHAYRWKKQQLQQQAQQ